MTGAGDWPRLGERGSMGALYFARWAHRLLGRRLAQLLLYPTVAWFYLRERAWNGASRRHLEAVWERPVGRAALGRPPGAFAALRHYHEFAIQIFDRLALWVGGLDAFRMEHEGFEREKGAEELAPAYVAELESARLQHPCQWFNFYDGLVEDRS